MFYVRPLRPWGAYAIWVISWNRGNSGTYTHVTCTPLHPPRPPFFFLFLPFFGLCSPQMVHLLPIPNMEWAVYEF